MQAHTSTCQPRSFLSLWTEGLALQDSGQPQVRTEQSWGGGRTLGPYLGFSLSPAPTKDRWLS